MKQESEHTKIVATEEEERREILRRYKHLIEVWHTRKEVQDRWEVRKAFRVAADAHKDMRRRTGEPYIFHPLAVATIAAGELGLGRTSIIAALLHDTVEDTDLTLDDVKAMFGEKVSRIIDGLTKIEGISETSYTSAQAETIKKILLTLSKDVRVILVKLADRLHNMRTLNAMPRLKQLKIASETRFIYAPLANRLGLYEMKAELEELSFKYSNPDIYKQISGKIQQQMPALMQQFEQIKEPLDDFYRNSKHKLEIRLRKKSAFSVWRNMNEKELLFEDVFLTPTIEIIVDSKPEQEKYECWSVYASVSTIFKYNNSVVQDFISQPKANGYSAIHATVMMPGGHWANIQIRSRRMEEIATKGYAAYWKYKDQFDQEGLEKWLIRTKELLKETEKDAIPFIDDFNSNLFSDEIYVFTPTGDMITLPVKGTVLDFAYAIHTDLGKKCIGANVNHKVKGIDYELQTGDQVEIIASKTNKTTEKQLDFVVTARAKSNIKASLNAERRKYREEGEKKFREICKQLKAKNQQCQLEPLIEKLGLSSKTDFYYLIAIDKINIKNIKAALFGEEQKSVWRRWPSILTENLLSNKKNEPSQKPETDKNLLIDKNKTSGKIDFIVATCCNPIPGDDVVTIIKPGKPKEIHRTNCSNAIKYMTQYGKKITNPNWNQSSDLFFLAGIKLVAENQHGMIKTITSVISDEYNLSIRKFDLETIGDIVEASIFLYIKNLHELKRLMKSLRKIKEIIKVIRIEKF